MTTTRAALTLVVTVLAALVACPRPAVTATVDEARRTDFVRGVGLGLFATDPEYDYAHLLDEIVAHGATDVLIVVAHYQTSIKDHDIGPRPRYSPSLTTVERTLNQARRRGLRTALLPIVRLKKRTRREWRGRIAPEAGVDTWFAAYRDYILGMARIAERTAATRFGVGSELLSLERHAGSWRSLIEDVRGVYKGRVFYSANWDHHQPIQFWDAVDEVGVTAYYELTRDLRPPSVETLVASWQPAIRELAGLARRVGKPMFISEVGYPSKVTGARYPWDETRKAKLDLELQATLYRAFCQAFTEAGVIDGVYFWNWFGFGGAKDGGYTPRGKPAAAVMNRCLRDGKWDRSPRVPQPTTPPAKRPETDDEAATKKSSAPL